jgi:hypothetical protein
LGKALAETAKCAVSASKSKAAFPKLKFWESLWITSIIVKKSILFNRNLRFNLKQDPKKAVKGQDQR